MGVSLLQLFVRRWLRRTKVCNSSQRVQPITKEEYHILAEVEQLAQEEVAYLLKNKDSHASNSIVPCIAQMVQHHKIVDSEALFLLMAVQHKHQTLECRLSGMEIL